MLCYVMRAQQHLVPIVWTMAFGLIRDNSVKVRMHRQRFGKAARRYKDLLHTTLRTADRISDRSRRPALSMHSDTLGCAFGWRAERRRSSEKVKQHAPHYRSSPPVPGTIQSHWNYNYNSKSNCTCCAKKQVQFEFEFDLFCKTSNVTGSGGSTARELVA